MDPGDRHLHKRRGNRHKDPGDDHPCVCGYASCPRLRKGYVGTDHAYDRIPIRFKKPDDPNNPLWLPFQESLIRNLHVSDEWEEKIRSGGAGFRFSVAAHHFDIKLLQKYPAMRGMWRKRFNHEEATALLHNPLDNRDTDGGQYFVNANNSVVDAAVQMATLRSDRGTRAATRTATDDSETATLASSTDATTDTEEALRKCQDVVESLRKERKVLLQKCKRRGERVQNVEAENERLRKRAASEYTIEELTDILRKVGGISRATLFDRKWHENHAGAAKCLWGFNSFDETLVMVECLFPDVDLKELPQLQPNKRRRVQSTGASDSVKMPYMSQIEKCLVCRLFFRRDLTQEFIGLIVDRHRTTVGLILKEWAPRWGKAGEQCSCLDITKAYLDAEEPDRSKTVGVTRAFCVDGTDTQVENNKKDPTANAILYGPKNNVKGARCLSWCTAAALSFEHTPKVGARCSEKRIYRWWGSLGKKSAPIKDWKDIAVGLSPDDLACRFVTALDDMFDYHDMEETIDAVTFLVERHVGPIESDVNLTATEDNVSKMSAPRGSSTATASSATADPRIPRMEDIDKWWIRRRALKKVKETSEKKAPSLDRADVLEQSKAALLRGVNSSGKEKLAQLEVHERLHQAYEGKRLKKTMLAFFLKTVEGDRHKLLKWMGSSLAPRDMPMPTEDELPTIWLRLAKIPREYGGLGDKGFFKTTRLNPNMNHMRTPFKLSDDQVVEYRRGGEMIKADQETSYTRAPVEIDYSRYRNEETLHGIVPYWQLVMLPYVNEWAHANMNLLDPVRKPGSQSIAAEIDDYWDKHCNARTPDPTKCKTCESGPEMKSLWQCTKCSHYFHDDCHEIGKCA